MEMEMWNMEISIKQIIFFNLKNYIYFKITKLHDQKFTITEKILEGVDEKFFFRYNLNSDNL